MKKKQQRPTLPAMHWIETADVMLKNGYSTYKPARRQKQPQYWVIESLRPHLSEDWVMASEAMASAKSEDSARKMTPRRISTAINILKRHVERCAYNLLELSEVNYRLRNLRTGEIIPWEAIGTT